MTPREQAAFRRGETVGIALLVVAAMLIFWIVGSGIYDAWHLEPPQRGEFLIGACFPFVFYGLAFLAVWRFRVAVRRIVREEIGKVRGASMAKVTQASPD